MKSYHVQANELGIQAITYPIICHTIDCPVIMEQKPSFPGIYMKQQTGYHCTTPSDTQPLNDIEKQSSVIITRSNLSRYYILHTALQ